MRVFVEEDIWGPVKVLHEESVQVIHILTVQMVTLHTPIIHLEAGFSSWLTLGRDIWDLAALDQQIFIPNDMSRGTVELPQAGDYINGEKPNTNATRPCYKYRESCKLIFLLSVSVKDGNTRGHL